MYYTIFYQGFLLPLQRGKPAPLLHRMAFFRAGQGEVFDFAKACHSRRQVLSML